MPTVKDDVMDMVREAIQEDPEVANKELYERAREIDDSIGDLSLRQFHARYPLQVKRQIAQKRSGGGRKKSRKAREKQAGDGAGGVDRGRIRETLIRFAKDVSAAEGKADVIDLLTDVESYVDDVVEAMDGGS